MTSKVLRPVALACLVVGSFAATSTPSSAVEATGPVAVSSTSVDPFAGCNLDFPEVQPGVLYPNSEIEPSVAVNPTDNRNIVTAWQQDRWSSAASRGIVVATTFDGGVTWTTVTTTKTSLCTGGSEANGGAMFRASNAWVSFGPDGTAYLVSLGIPFFDQSAVLVSTSTDGGLSWSDPSVLQQEANNAMNDKTTITADPNVAGLAYAVWTRNEVPTEQASATAAQHAAASRGPAWFSRTLDGGRTWEAARPIFDPGEKSGTLGHQIVVLPADRFDGELLNIFDVEYVTNAVGLRGIHVASIRSDDKGATWSASTPIGDALFKSVLDPLTGAAVRTGANLPDVAVDPRNGTLYAVWMDARFSGGEHDDIALSMSTDGGLTWTPPTKANRTPLLDNAANMQTFTPSVDVSADGTVAISYYDFRQNGTDTESSQPLETDRYMALCTQPSATAVDGCAVGWTEVRLTPASFNLRVAPNSLGLYLGGYQGLAHAGNRFVSLFTEANSTADPATIYFSATP